MKIVLYFSAAFGLFWLIHGAPSQHDPAKRNSIRHSNANRDREKYLTSESSNLQDKVLIKSELPLRGRKIHQTAWSKEESDGERDHERKPSGQKKTNDPKSSLNLEKILKYLTSLVYTLDEKEQPTQILITSEDIKDAIEHAKTNTKLKQQSTKTDTEVTDKISKNNHKNGRQGHSSKYKNSYLDDYYELFHTEEKSGKNYEIKQTYENSFEYENSDEECDDESQINYQTNTEHWNIKSNHLYRDDEEYKSNHILIKSEASAHSQDSEECSEESDINVKQNSQEIKKIKEFKEEGDYKNKQKTVWENKFEDIKNQQSKTKKGGLAGKESHKIVVLNGTKVTGQNDKNSKNEGPLETTRIVKQKSKVELLDIENNVNEKTKEEVSVNELKKLQKDSNVVEEIVLTKSNNENIQNSQNTKDEFTNSVINMSVLNTSNGSKENQINSVLNTKPFNDQQKNETSFTETMETVYRRDGNLRNEVMNTEKVQNEETLVMTSSINNIAKINLDENNFNTFVVKPETLIDVRQQENMQTINNEKVQNEETFVMTNSISNIAKLNLAENNVNTLVVKPESLTDVKRQENMQTINNEKVQNEETLVIDSSINSVAKLNLDENNINTLIVNPETMTDVTRQENMQIINNEETINNAVDILTIQTNNAELNNRVEIEVQNKTPELKVSEIQVVEGNQDQFSQHQVNQISVTENNQQIYDYTNKNINKVNETLLISKDDNVFDYILGGNEFVPSNTYNEETYKVLSNNSNVFNINESENKSQLLTESIKTELQNVQQVDPEQQETFDTILEFIYKHSKNPFILALKENSSFTN